VFFVDEVPFVDEDDDALFISVGEFYDVDVLPGDPFFYGGDEDVDVGLVYGSDGSDDAVKFDVFFGACFFVYACGVGDDEFFAKEVVRGVCGVSGCVWSW